MNLKHLFTAPIRILLIADHPIVLAVLNLLIESHPRLILAGVADNYSNAIAIAKQEQPDITLLSISPDNSNGFDEVANLFPYLNRSRILVLIAEYDPALYQRAAELGVMGVVSKEDGPEALIKAIENVHSDNEVSGHSSPC